jgi:hypothetical protein
MNKIHRSLLFGVMAICFSLVSKAQNTQEELHARQSVDSFQRVKMKDSLQITDQVVNQIFAVRDSMVQRINSVRSNSALSSSEQDIQVSSIRNETNEAIKAILGEEKYLRYLEMITNSLRQRNKVNELPLAGEVLTKQRV